MKPKTLLILALMGFAMTPMVNLNQVVTIDCNETPNDPICHI